MIQRNKVLEIETGIHILGLLTRHHPLGGEPEMFEKHQNILRCDLL